MSFRFSTNNKGQQPEDDKKPLSDYEKSFEDLLGKNQATQ